MATTDALPVPKKNTAYRITFPIRSTTGAMVTGATGLDSEVDKDAAGFSDCTNEATEIGSSGIYYLDLSAAEMNADTITVLVKTSTVGAINPVIVLYPEETGDIRVKVTDSTALVRATATTGTLTTTQFTTDLTEVTDNHYNGRVLIFVSGNLVGQATSITDYDGSTKTLTVTAMTEAPANTDQFWIV